MCILVLSFTAIVRAHDPYTSWTSVRFHDDRVEVRVALARASALLLLPGGEKLPTITPENFERYRTALMKAGATLVQITAAGAALTPQVEEVAITELENDIEFRLRTPRPKAGPLLLTARFVERLVDEHVATVVVLDRDGKSLGWEPLSLQTPTMKIALQMPTQ